MTFIAETDIHLLINPVCFFSLFNECYLEYKIMFS